MKNIAKVTAMIFPSIFFWQFNTLPSHAWFKVCNKLSSSQPIIRVAFTYLDTNDNRANSYARYNNGWVTEGWYGIERGGCATVYPHELWRRNKYYYVHISGNTGSSYFCVDTRRDAFKINENESCNFGNRRRVGFTIYDIGRNQNFTVLIY